MQVKLRVMRGSNAGREIKVPAGVFLIGRSEECHLRPRSEAISRRHCAVRTAEEQVSVDDFGSKNGTYVNDQRVEGSVALQPGDRLRFGPLEFEVIIERDVATRVEASRAVAGGKRPAVRDVKDVAARSAPQPSVEEQDITGWLEEPDETVDRKVADTDTRQYRLEETNYSKTDPAGETQADVKSPMSHDTLVDQPVEGTEEPSPGDQPDGDKQDKKRPMRLPKAPRLSGADSREAAAEMLKRFFNRR